jgi:hypothetical protein
MTIPGAPIHRVSRVLVTMVLTIGLVACSTRGSPDSGSPGKSIDGLPSGRPIPAATAIPTATPTPASPSPVPPAAWHRIETANGPGPREDHTWTIEPGTRSAWLFGGRDGSDAFGDLWRFDLTAQTWERVEPGPDPAPAARFGHTGSWVDGVGLVVWAGQANATTFFDDLWAYDPARRAWRELAAGSDRPAARYGSCAGLGPDERLWVSHGFTSDGGRFADTWAYDFSAEAWIDATPDGDVPVVRCLHDCLWTPDGRLVLYAGQTTGAPAIGDLWTRGVDEGWTRGPEAAPESRQLYALASLDERAWVFGGGAADRSKLDDLWTLDLTSLDWRQLEPAGERPPGLSGAALIADPESGRLLLFGGLNEERASAETWAFGSG